MFNRSSFSPVSFSRISFNGVQAANEGRSGYWRLFFTNLQEESLRKESEKAAANSGKLAAPEVVVSAGKKQPKPDVSKRSTRIKAPQPAQSITPLVLAPVKTLPTVYEELAALPPLIMEQVIWRGKGAGVITSLDKELQRRRRKKVAAFLLMAA